ncbi:TniQ family protein [Jiella sp. M17.18]|uniref:TniQ family protein n=1 Tax=Jiella sp. M17.18 TaxID=3234247 RepID=UPI0034DF171A
MANRSARNRRERRGRTFGIRPDLMPRETASSYLSRLAYLTGRSVPDMKTEVGLDVRSIDLGDEAAIRLLAAKAGMGHGALARWSPRRHAGKNWRLHGQELGTEMVDRTFFRFCPACVAADLDRGGRAGSWMRAEWTVAPLRTCPEHGLVLVATTPDRIPFAPYDYCRTIAFLEDDVHRLAGEAVRQAPSPLETYLRDRLFTGTKDAIWPDGLAFHAAADLAEVFGAVALHGKAVRLTHLTPAERIAAGAAGHAVLAEGRAGIRRFLESLIRETRAGKGVWGPQLAIGRINDFLDARREDPGYAPAVDYVREVLMDEVPLDPDDVVLGVPVGERRVWNLRSLAREVGTTVPLLKTILQRNGLMSKKAEFRASRSTLDVDRVRELVALLDDEILTLPGVMRRTGLTRRHIEAIAEAGGFVSITGAGKVYNAQHRFGARNVDETMRRLLGGEPVDEVPAGMVPLGEARHAAICTFPEVLRLVLEGRLSRVARLVGTEGLDAVLVPKDEVVRLTVPSAPTRGLTRIEVQHRTRLTQRPVQKLFEHRIFDLEVVRNPVKRSEQVVATEESVERFMRDVVGLHPLAKHHGVHFRRMKAIMEAAGIEPLLDPVEFHGTFYPRQIAEGLNLDDVDPDDVVVTRRTRSESIEHGNQVRKATARPAAEVLREVAAGAKDGADEQAGRKWTRLGRSRRIKGTIGRKRVPSRRWTAERQV